MTTPLQFKANPVYLITGGTGSFGRAFTRHLMDNVPAARIRIYSRDEAKQEDMQRDFGFDARLTFILGDVRDVQHLSRAADKADAIVHAAALKRVPAGEKHSDEFIKTNIVGSANVVEAALLNHVPRTLLIGSDKAVQPINEYGKTKAVAEGLFVQANRRGVTRGCRFAAVRGGNVWGSRGNVVEAWDDEVQRHGTLTMHDPDATRFYLPMPAWCGFVHRALCDMHGGEIFVPKLRAWRVGDLAAAFAAENGGALIVAGLRPGDKVHETLIAPHEALRSIDAGWCYVVQPNPELRQVWNYDEWAGDALLNGFGYSSDRVERLGVDELRGLINGEG